MSLNKKILLYAVISLAILLVVLGFLSYQEVRKNVEEEAYRICERLVAEVEASRSYVREVLRPKTRDFIKSGEFIPEIMSASFVARNIFERFLKLYPDYHIKFASFNPRNLINKADKVEVEILNYFKQESELNHKWEGIVSRKGQDYFTVAKSFPLRKACLRCHGDPTEAPKSLIERYGNVNGFGMKVGDVTMYSVGVPMTIAYSEVGKRTFSKFWPAMLVVIIFFVTITGFFKQLVSNPIEKLVNVVNQFAKGDYDARVDVKKVGKLKGLAEAYNKMASLLSEQISRRKMTENQLLDYQSKLESQVEERTTELSEVNNSLEQKISKLEVAEEHIKSSLLEKETLLYEVNHRVKNNLAVVSSLLQLQANDIKNEQTKAVLLDSRNRVQSISNIHEALYVSDNFSSIDLKKYLLELGEEILRNQTINTKVKFNIKTEAIMVGVKHASPLGLIINELITNSIKYAFPNNQEGKIILKLQQSENQLEMEYADNGVGIPSNFDWKNSKTLGLKLVHTLVENQLDGSLDMESNNGTKLTIKFNIES